MPSLWDFATARARRVPLWIGCGALAFLLTACPGDDDPPPTTAAPTTTPPTTAAPIDGTAAVGAFFDALASRDPVSSASMLDASAPNSLARSYATHQAAVRGVLGASDGGSVERSTDRAVVCAGPAGPEQRLTCTEYRDLEFDDQGRLASFTIDGRDLDQRVITDGPAATVDRLTAQAVSAYQSPSSDSTLVVVELTNDGSSEFELFAFSATYRPTADAAAVEADGSWGTTAVGPGATTAVVIRFPDAPLGGALVLSGWSDASIGTTLTLRVTNGP